MVTSLYGDFAKKTDACSDFQWLGDIGFAVHIQGYFGYNRIFRESCIFSVYFLRKSRRESKKYMVADLRELYRRFFGTDFVRKNANVHFLDSVFGKINVESLQLQLSLWNKNRSIC